MTGSLFWQWLPNTQEEESRWVGYRQLVRDLSLQVFANTDQKPLSFLVAGAEESAQQDGSAMSSLAHSDVLLSATLRGVNPRYSKQGRQALQSLSQSKVGVTSLLSAPFLVALINELALMAGKSAQDDASAASSLDFICHFLGQHNVVLQQTLRESVSQPNQGKIDRLLANTGIREGVWTTRLDEAANMLEWRGLPKSCGLIAKVLREVLTAATQAGSSSSSSKRRTLYDPGHLAKRRREEPNSHRPLDDLVAVTVNILSSMTMLWSDKALWFQALLSCAGPEHHEDFLKQIVTGLTHRCDDPGQERYQTILFGVLPRLFLELAKQGGRGDLMVAVSEFTRQFTSSADSDEASARLEKLAESLKSLQPNYDLEMSDGAQQSSDEGAALLSEITIKARQGGSTESAFLQLEYLNDSGKATQLMDMLKKFPSASAILNWLPSALQQAVRALNANEADTFSLEPVAAVCTSLLDTPHLLYDLFCFATPQELLRPFEDVFMNPQVFESLDWPSAGGDEGPAQLKQILLFMQAVQAAQRAHIFPPFAPRREDADVSRLDEDERTLTSRWISELFDSDGIGDELIRDSPPSLLLKLAPIIFSQSLTAAEIGVIDLDMLKSGLSFFLQDLLSYTLPRVVSWLVQEIKRVTTLKVDRRDQRRPVALEPEQQAPQQRLFSRTSGLITILHMILLDDSCPPFALQVVKEPFAALLQQGILSVVQGGSLQYKTEDYDVSLVLAMNDRLASVSPFDRAHRHSFLPSTLSQPPYLDCVSELEPFAALMTWSDATRPLVSLRKAVDRVIRLRSDVTDSESALRYLAWLIVLNLRNAGISLGQSLTVLGFFDDPLHDETTHAFLTKVLILAHILRVASNLRAAQTLASSSADDAINVDELADAFLLQTIMAVFPPAEQGAPVKKAEVGPRRELVRQCLQSYVSVTEQNAGGAASSGEVDNKLSNFLEERSTKLWDAIVA